MFCMEQFTRINHDIGIMGGKACIAGTRITVGMILMQISEGITYAELLAQYPNLTENDILNHFSAIFSDVDVNELKSDICDTLKLMQEKGLISQKEEVIY